MPTASKVSGKFDFFHPAIKRALFASAASCTGLMCFAQSGLAQTAAPANGQAAPQIDADAHSGQLAEIVVTAQKRSESAQRVPITISVISPDAFKAAGISDTASLVSLVPGLILNRQSAVAQPFLRGIGSNISAAGSEATVSTYVDGVYHAAGEGNIFELNNIERVEVLKGPQGTLFGRNSIGGVISVTTKDPAQTPHLDVMGGYGNYQTYEGSLYASTGLTKDLAADIAVHYQDQVNGWGTNVSTGGPAFNNQHDFEARSKWVWTPDSQTKVTLIGDYFKARTGVGSNTAVHAGEADIIGQPSPGFYNLAITSPAGVQVEQGGVSLKIARDVGFANLVSISAWRRTHSVTNVDVDASAAPLLDVYEVVRSDQITQEIQLVSESNSKIKWIVGAFYFHNNTRVPADLYGEALAAPTAYGGFDALAPAGTIFIGNSQDTKEITTSYSGFGEVTATLLEDTHVTGGIRYTADKQQFNTSFWLLTEPGTSSPFYTGPFMRVAPPVPLGLPQYCTPGLPCTEASSKNFDKVTYRGVLDHQFTKDVMIFASYNFGFQSGLYNTFIQSFSGPNTPVSPETNRAIEVGLKSELLDHKLRINISAFQNKLSNLQVYAVLAGVSTATNAGKSTIRGIDADFEVAPTDRLTIRGGLEILDAKFDSYPGAQYFTYVPPAQRTAASPTPLASYTADAAGNYLPQAPKFTAVISGNYTVPTQVGRFGLTGSVTYNDGFFWDPQNRLAQPSYFLVNASIGWTHPSGKFEVTFWTRNLANAKIDQFGLPESFGDEMSPAAPRTYGIRIGAHF